MLDIVRAALADAGSTYIRSEASLRTSDDPEAVHKARVSVRKLRSYLKTFEPVLDPNWATELRERLHRLQDVLAPVRDADVFADHLERLHDLLPPVDARRAHDLLEHYRHRAKQQHDALRESLHESWYIPLLEEIVDAERNPQMRDNPQARDALAGVMMPVFKRLRKTVRRAGSHPSDQSLHQIRIKSKHVRYAAEAFASVVGKRAAEYAKRAEALQEILGEQHDGVVAVERLREFDGTAESRFAAGELAMLAHDRGNAGCGQWRAIFHGMERKKHRFW